MSVPRISGSVFLDLFIYMAGFGLLTGIAYPFFMPLFGVSGEEVMRPVFFASSIMAGMLMGVINFMWVHMTVRPHLRLLSDRMLGIESALSNKMYQADWEAACGHVTCHIENYSKDEIGRSSQAFNALVDALLRSHDVEYTLKQLSTTLSSSLAMAEMGDAALRLIIEKTHSNAGCLFVEDKGRLLPIANIGIQDVDRLVKDPLLLYSMDMGRAEVISLPEDIDIQVNALLTSFRPKEVLVVPVSYQDKSLGVLVLANTAEFTEDSHGLIKMFTQGLGLAMSNAITHGQLQDMASMDPLTSVYNRRFGLNRLREEFQRAQRGQLPMAVVMIDLDHFKQVNDTYGHLMGDRVLVEVSEVVRAAMRDEDILVRYGGEELLMVLPGADLKTGTSIADRIRHLIEDMVVSDGEKRLHVTASMGVSAIPRAFTENELQLIKAADDALYQAKAAGRNRVFSTR